MIKGTSTKALLGSVVIAISVAALIVPIYAAGLILFHAGFRENSSIITPGYWYAFAITFPAIAGAALVAGIWVVASARRNFQPQL
jgi:hypothetical protein